MASPIHPDPIVAIATAPGRAAVGMVRVSGKGLMPLAKRLCGKVLRPREATYTAFLDADGTAIDFGLALYFAAPHSFTGEDVLELQAHGGTVVLQLLLARCLSAACEFDDADQPCLPCLPYLRLAHPGEFSERAFLNDKIDLTQAEAIADLIDASTEAAARSASRSLAGDHHLQTLSQQDPLAGFLHQGIQTVLQSAELFHRVGRYLRVKVFIWKVKGGLNVCAQVCQIALQAIDLL